jgi:hypothetical protein
MKKMAIIDKRYVLITDNVIVYLNMNNQHLNGI